MRLRWLILIAAIGCEERVYDDLPNDRLPRDEAGYREGREEAIAAARIAAKVACDRLWGDCSSLCDEIFVYCGNSKEQCVNDYARSAVEDLVYPVYSRELAEQCADQLGERSCLDLDPSSAECRAVVLEGCPNDDDGYARPYSWLAAHNISSLPTTLSPRLCEDVPEWFVFQLEAGERLGTTLISGTGTAWLSLYAPIGQAGGRRDVQEIGHSIYVDPMSRHQETAFFDPVPTAGIYYLKIDLNRSLTADLELAIGTDRRTFPTAYDVAVETEKIVYRALCERLHGDCNSNCGEVDFFCGDSVEACTEAYAHSAVERLFDDDPRPLDRALAASCAADLAQRASCDFQNASCGELFISHCASDPLSYGRPWSGRLAEHVSLPVVINLDLCDDVYQYYRFDLNAGDQLVIRTEVDPIDTTWGYLFPPDATEEQLARGGDYLFHAFYLDSRETITDPVPFTGTYYFRVQYNTNGPIRLMLRRL